MEPKDKAEQLVDKMIPHTRVFHEVLGWEDYYDSAKQCALIAVNEILNLGYDDRLYLGSNDVDYWKQVKKEINDL